ncbi:leucine zipper domain-containing protein [Streptomyces sp. GXMU-J5]|uniref:Leucine zipper domain-containing protein n=2 Tax=Streptomyces beihaiensis TaxID=2984495 RepID=A0ABT3TMW5_9ACTN|nr:leucine zipper domain-containing protein [Streptomyces beihaiensis]MCX3058337.1 leucine zipper domain-containing protein [Streptomyces beihaiensis]
MVIETRRPIPEVAEELGIHSRTPHTWVSQWRRNGSTPVTVGCVLGSGVRVGPDPGAGSGIGMVPA